MNQKKMQNQVLISEQLVDNTDSQSHFEKIKSVQCLLDKI